MSLAIVASEMVLFHMSRTSTGEFCLEAGGRSFTFKRGGAELLRNYLDDALKASLDDGMAGL